MASDPFFLPPRSVVSFSGGRTSGYMLRRILDAHGGSLPGDRAVLFCNTGLEREETLDFVEECSRRWGVPIVWLEREETLDFVEECSRRWGVPIVWLEYRWTEGLPIVRDRSGKPLCNARESHGFAVVTHATASRKGEPMEAAIKARRSFREAKGEPPILPHVRGRFCTSECKTRTKGRYIREALGWTDGFTNAIGFRADEPGRVADITACDYEVDASCRGEKPLCPLADAGVTEKDVMAFWAAQPFDLGIRQHEGNCTLCFMKSPAKIKAILREHPGLGDWWVAQEEATGDVFREDRPSYARLRVIAQEEGPGLFDDDGEPSIGCFECTN